MSFGLSSVSSIGTAMKSTPSALTSCFNHRNTGQTVVQDGLVVVTTVDKSSDLKTLVESLPAAVRERS